jgi:plasmid stability protein
MARSTAAPWIDILMLGGSHQEVRTTLTLDDDVAARLRAQMRRHGRSLKETVNEALRVGLDRAANRPKQRRFVVKARCLELRPGLSVDRVQDLLDEVDGTRRP